MSPTIILLNLLLLTLVGVIPVWAHSRQWGYTPSRVVGVTLLVVMVFLVMGAL